MPLIFGFAAVVVALLVLFVPRPIGLADNGDEARLPCHLGLAPTYAWGQTQYANSVNFLWHRGVPPEGLNCEVRSSAVVPMRVAASISGEDLSGFFDAWLHATTKPADTVENGLG